MAENTKIAWTNHTFNPWRGCTKIAPGCANCYADAQSRRNPKVLGVWGPRGTRVVAAESQWKAVERWNREAGKAGVRHRVFVASLADVFEDWQGPMVNPKGETLYRDPTFQQAREITRKLMRGDPPSESDLTPLTMGDVRQRLFRLIDLSPHLDFLLVTKRPENVRKFWPWGWGTAETHDTVDPMIPRWPDGELIPKKPPYRRNVWLLTSVSDQHTADAMIPALLQCRDLSPVLGISAEPLLGAIDLDPWIARLDWTIVGGESGTGARACNVDWIRYLVGQCRNAGVAAFVKQLGGQPIELNGTGFFRHMMLRDKKGGDLSEWPEDVRVREFPEVPQ